jgi:hypothetical protein
MSEEIDHKQLAVELLAGATEERGNPASTLALLGIGNALLEIAEQLESLRDLHELDTIGKILMDIAYRKS